MSHAPRQTEVLLDALPPEAVEGVIEAMAEVLLRHFGQPSGAACAAPTQPRKGQDGLQTRNLRAL